MFVFIPGKWIVQNCNTDLKRSTTWGKDGGGANLLCLKPAVRNRAVKTWFKRELLYSILVLIKTCQRQLKSISNISAIQVSGVL